MSTRDEADILAEMFGTRKPAPAPAPAPPPSPAAEAPQAQGATLPPGRYPIVIALALGAVGAWIWFAGMLLQWIVATSTISEPALVELIVTVVLFGGLFAIAFAASRFARVRGQTRRVAWPLALSLGLACGFIGQCYAVSTIWMAGALAPPVDPVGPCSALLVLASSLLVLFQTAAEEAFFRGWLQPVLAKGWGRNVGIAGAAIAFALLHVVGGTRDPLSIVNLFMGGLVFGLLAWRTGTVAAAIGAHFAWNWVEECLFGLDPNPGIGTFGSITDFDMVGSALWGGSGEGLNASIAITFALVALATLLIPWGRTPQDEPAAKGIVHPV